eukprot:1159836-Pelagomonas_calceolata.AAC.5
MQDGVQLSEWHGHLAITDGLKAADDPRGSRAWTCVEALLAKPPLRGDTRRASPRGASPMVFSFHSFAHTRPVWLTYIASGSGTWYAPITKMFRRLAKVWNAPVHTVLRVLPKVPKTCRPTSAVPWSKGCCR